MATIELLNHDILIEIFSYLSLYERQRMELGKKIIVYNS